LKHLALSSGTSSVSSFEGMPSIVLLGYNVHGNEPSSSEAAILMAYYLTAVQGPQIEQYLKDAVIFIDPSYNPDGRDRHTTWVNSHKAFPPVANAFDREHNEAWPGGRTNHYWFDLNRDWLPLEHVESQNRIEFYHKWLPNVVTDFHEMGTSSTYFFEPTEPFGSENPVVPRSNYDQLNNLFAKYYQEALDDIGSLYFTKEQYDNSYPGYGSTYPDIQGGLGMVFEQASSRGHVQSSNTRDIEFSFTIRNHFRSSLATVKASVENREVLLNHQQIFFNSALDEANANPVKGYVFSKGKDRGRTNEFVNLLLRHHIKTYNIGADIQAGGKIFKANEGFVVPSNQPQYRMVRTMFEKVTDFYDSVFYDASTWNMAYAYNMNFEELRTTRFKLGPEIILIDQEKAVPNPANSKYAWLVKWEEYYAPKALYHLLKNDVVVKTAFKPFQASVNGQPMDFDYGSLMIPVYDQRIDMDDLNRVVREASELANVEFHSVETGMSLKGVDLGSRSFRTVKLPKTLMLIGDGVSSYEAGEVWFLFDSKIGMPITKMDVSDFNRANLHDFDVLILVSGGYSTLGESGATKIKDWVQSGGTLYAQRTAVNWVVDQEIAKAEFEKFDSEESERRDYDTSSEHFGSKRIGGSIYLAKVDRSHPLAFGISSDQIPVYRNHRIFLMDSENAYSNVVKYESSPYLAGYIHPENLEKLNNRTSMIASRSGRGHIILLADNPNFRAYWYGTSKLLFNSVFFGNLY